MSDIFGGVEPPAWLQRMTQNQPGQLGRIFGELVGGFATATEDSIATAKEKQSRGIDTNWIKELPGQIQPGFAEARLNLTHPMWRMQAQQAQLNLAQQQLQMQNTQSQIDSRKTKMAMTGQDQTTMSNWLQDHPTWESRQDAQPPQLLTTEAQRMYRDVQLGDAADVKHKAVVEGISDFSKSVDELRKLNPTAAAPFAVQIGKVPTPELQNKLGSALQAERDKAAAAGQPRATELVLPNGTKVQGIMEPGPSGRDTFKIYTDPEKAAKTKADAATKRGEESRKSTAEKEALIYARGRIERLEKLMEDPMVHKDKNRISEVTQQWLAARKYLNGLLKKSGSAEPTAGDPANPTAPTAAAPAGNDPLNLGLSQ